jgi:hypothetical protein
VYSDPYFCCSFFFIKEAKTIIYYKKAIYDFFVIGSKGSTKRTTPTKHITFILDSVNKEMLSNNKDESKPYGCLVDLVSFCLFNKIACMDIGLKGHFFLFIFLFYPSLLFFLQKK